MPKGDKYSALTQYLANSGQEQVAMTFAELEALCGLPASAYRWPACWSNSSETSLGYGWLLAGYIADQYDLEQQTVVFSHQPKQADDYLARPAKRAKDRQDYDRYCRTHAALAETVDMLPLVLSASHFHQDLLSDPNSRYRSWEHCYGAFQAHQGASSPDALDYLSLHLAWYLASWGMLRGGAFLLQKDYKVHIPAVRLLMEARWGPLWSLSRRDLMDGAFAEPAMELAAALRRLYQDTIHETPSDTLLTKIMLGTVGCTPAYDRYLRWALRETRTASPTFGSQSLRQLGRFYAVQWERLEPLRAKCSGQGIKYPPMKLLDMCFFQYGLEHSKTT